MASPALFEVKIRCIPVGGSLAIHSPDLRARFFAVPLILSLLVC